MYSIGTPVKHETLSNVEYGVITEIVEYQHRWLTVTMDSGNAYVYTDDDPEISHRTLTLAGEPHFFDVDGSGVLTLWHGTPEDATPQPVDVKHVPLWMHLWASTD